MCHKEDELKFTNETTHSLRDSLQGWSVMSRIWMLVGLLRDVKLLASRRLICYNRYSKNG
jgi:hypothetical protein